MAHHILVIEYEPRYIQRIEEAAVGSGLSTEVARTGDEAIQALPRGRYDLIVLSTIIPRYSTAQLIRSIRNDATNASTPILLTTSGYSGTDPRSDAVKIGASDMLVKPYAPPDFLQKVRSILNVPVGGADVSEESSAETVRLSSKQIFGDLLDESHPASRTLEQQAPSEPEETVKVPKMSPPPQSGAPVEPPGKRRRTAAEDVDRMLADTLAGVRIPTARKKKPTAPEDLDKLLENTLSGLGSSRTKEARSPVPEESKSPESRVETAPETPHPATEPELPSPPEQVSAAADEVEEDPFPEVEASEEPRLVTDSEPEMPPFEGVEERTGESKSSGTTLIRDEEPPREPEGDEEEPEEIGDSGHFGQYVLLEKIATGGMAEVWKARMRGLEGFEKIVAIKKILPHLSDNDEFIDMFVDEAKLAAQLSHNNIIHIYDLGKIDGSWFIAMEYNDGYDLKSLISQGKEVQRPLPVPLALFIASKIASALDYAHRKRGFDDQELGVVHRDVSPQNVLISREGDIKICDFGIAKAASKASHTQAGALKGKLQYMSPEQAWGRHVDHRSDIFATAAVLFEMLAGRKLFTGDSELSVLDQVREARVPSPSTYNPEVASEIDEIVLKGLEKDPAARFHTAGEMARAIDGVISNYKPAPTSGDLARYIAAIEEPELEPMPAMPVLQKPATPPADQPAPKQEEVVKPAPAPETAPPVPVRAPVPDSEPQPMAPIAEITDETIPAPRMPELDETPAEPAAHMSGAMFESQAAPKKSRIVPIAIILIVLAALAGGAVMMMRPEAESGGPATDVSAALGANPPANVAPVPEQTTDVAEPGIDDAVTLEALDAEQLADAADSGELDEEDLALIEQAVRDRIAAERRRLESQRDEAAPPPAQTQRSQPDPPAPARTPTPTQTAAPTRTPTPVSTPPSEQPTSSAPAETTTAQAADTPARPTATQTAAAEPEVTPPQEPAPQTPAQPAVRRGDVIEPGTPGLTGPELISLRKVPYPPLARRNRVEGLIIVRALISEDGNVLETELLRGVSQNVGLNEAAIEMVRGGKFSPGRMGEVPVRVWKTIPIPFKMQ